MEPVEENRFPKAYFQVLCESLPGCQVAAWQALRVCRYRKPKRHWTVQTSEGFLVVLPTRNKEVDITPPVCMLFGYETLMVFRPCHP